MGVVVQWGGQIQPQVGCLTSLTVMCNGAATVMSNGAVVAIPCQAQTPSGLIYDVIGSEMRKALDDNYKPKVAIDWSVEETLGYDVSMRYPVNANLFRDDGKLTTYQRDPDWEPVGFVFFPPMSYKSELEWVSFDNNQGKVYLPEPPMFPGFSNPRFPGF